MTPSTRPRSPRRGRPGRRRGRRACRARRPAASPRRAGRPPARAAARRRRRPRRPSRAPTARRPPPRPGRAPPADRTRTNAMSPHCPRVAPATRPRRAEMGDFLSLSVSVAPRLARRARPRSSRKRVGGDGLGVGDLAVADAALELGARDPGEAHVGLGVLAGGLAGGEVGGEVGAPALGGQRRGRRRAGRGRSGGRGQAGLLAQLAGGELLGRASWRGRGRCPAGTPSAAGPAGSGTARRGPAGHRRGRRPGRSRACRPPRRGPRRRRAGGRCPPAASSTGWRRSRGCSWSPRPMIPGSLRARRPDRAPRRARLLLLSGRASRHRPVHGRLRRPSDRAPAQRAAAAAGQGRRLGQRPRRRPRLQAAELDEPAVLARRGSAGRAERRGSKRLDRAQQGRRDADDHPRGDPARLQPRARRRPGAGQGRRRGAPAGAARRSTSRPWAPADAWSAASTRPRSARSTCCAATPTAARSPWRSSGAARSTASSS